jgi:hypothetical protein
MFNTRFLAAFGLARARAAVGCAPTQKSSAAKAKAAKVASSKSKKKSRFTKENTTDYSLGEVDEKLLKRGQDNMQASAFDSL